MKTLIFDQSERVAQWVESKAPNRLVTGNDFGIGVEDNGELIGGVVFNEYNGRSITLHVAGLEQRWLSRDLLFSMFDYPFNYMKCERITAAIWGSNAKSLKFAHKLGFTMEGVIRQFNPDGSDLVIFGMLKDECRYLKEC